MIRRSARHQAHDGRTIAEAIRAAALESVVPELSRFFGIVVAMHYSDHPPSHVHACYGRHDAHIDIDTGRLLAGSQPPGAQRFVSEWLALHRVELLANWQRAASRQPLNRIDPLK